MHPDALAFSSPTGPQDGGRHGRTRLFQTLISHYPDAVCVLRTGQIERIGPGLVALLGGYANAREFLSSAPTGAGRSLAQRVAHAADGDVVSGTIPNPSRPIGVSGQTLPIDDLSVAWLATPVGFSVSQLLNLAPVTPPVVNPGDGQRARFLHALRALGHDSDSPALSAVLSHSAVALTDLAGVIHFVNDRFVELSGYDRTELVGATHQLVNSSVHSLAFFEDLWATTTRGEVWRGEVCNKQKNGQLYWLDTTLVPLTDSRGTLVGHLAIRTDITERKLADTQLRYSAARDRLFADVIRAFLDSPSAQLDAAINAAIGRVGAFLGADRSYLFEIEGGQMANTHEWCAPGVQPELATNQHLAVADFPFVHPLFSEAGEVRVRDVSSLPDEFSDQRDFLVEQSIQSLALVSLIRAGDVVGFLGFDSVQRQRDWSDAIIQELHRLAAVISTAQQRARAHTAVEQAEERSRLLLESAAEGLFGVDRDGRFTFANAAVGRILGYDVHELVGQPAHPLLHGRRCDGTHYPWSTCPVFATLNRGTLSSVSSESMIRSDGTLLPVEYRSRPIIKNDEIVGAVVTFGDVSELRSAKKLLEEQAAVRERMEGELRLAHRLEAVGQLAAGVAHEINTPMQYIGDSVHFLAEASADVMSMVDLVEGLVEALRGGGGVSDQMWADFDDAWDAADVPFLREQVAPAFARTFDGIQRVSGIVQAMKEFSHPGHGELEATDLNAMPIS